jgi:hypothetical protein
MEIFFRNIIPVMLLFLASFTVIAQSSKVKEGSELLGKLIYEFLEKEL